MWFLNLARSSEEFRQQESNVLEQQYLREIVRQTSENLIDISNTHISERLPHQDSIDRASAYQ